MTSAPLQKASPKKSVCCVFGTLTPVLLSAVLTLWLAGYVWFNVSALAIKPLKAPPHADAIIVLTGGNHRITSGLKLYGMRYARNILISGVHQDVSLKKILSLWKGGSALPSCCLKLDYLARTTKENAEESAQWIGKNNYKSIILVTSAYHMPRATMEFNRILPELALLPYPVFEDNYTPSHLRFWAINFSEYNKLLLRRISIFLGD